MSKGDRNMKDSVETVVFMSERAGGAQHMPEGSEPIPVLRVFGLA